MGRIAGALIVAAFVGFAATVPALADCNAEAARIRRAEAELPKLDVAPPNDRQIVCITLETNVLFARAFAAHVKQCPRSPHVRNAQMWSRTGSSYAAQFNDRGCKPTIRPYRG